MLLIKIFLTFAQTNQNFIKMKTIFTFVALLFASSQTFAQTTPKGPTMGWSSWNTYFCNISDKLIKTQALYMSSKGYSKVGYKYVNIDDGFQGGRNKETGELIINKDRFPNGLKGVVDYIHGRGLKAGIYSDAGHNTCGNYYNGDVLSVEVGFYEHDQQDADMYFKDLGFDFVKVDYCGADGYQNSEKLYLDEKERYSAISNAIKATGRDDVRYNVCRWNYPGTWVSDVATSWRISQDINSSWGSIKDIIGQNLYLSAYCRNGCYNDMDMLEVGRTLSEEEDKTHFGMWCIMSSPLLIGCDLGTVKTKTLKLLTNTDLIEINQDTLYTQAYVAKMFSNGTYLLVKDLYEFNGNTRAIALYNPTDADLDMTLKLSDIDMAGKYKLRDLFAQKDLGEQEDNYTVNVPAHGTRIYKVEAEQRLERTLYEAETAYLSSYQEIYNNQAKETAVYSSDSNCSGGMKAGWLGKKASNDLQWQNVWSMNGGKYKMILKYQCGESRNIIVEVNGKKVKTLSCNSGGFSTVGAKTIDIELEQGNNVIRLYNTSGWMPDIDCMTLQIQKPEIVGRIDKTDCQFM